MAKQGQGPSRGPIRVGLLALHDRAFFERLLKAPREAMTALVNEGRLALTEDDMLQVEQLIQKQLAGHPGENALVMWERYHKTGLWDNGDWAELWKER